MVGTVEAKLRDATPPLRRPKNELPAVNAFGKSDARLLTPTHTRSESKSALRGDDSPPAVLLTDSGSSGGDSPPEILRGPKLTAEDYAAAIAENYDALQLLRISIRRFKNKFRHFSQEDFSLHPGRFIETDRFLKTQYLHLKMCLLACEGKLDAAIRDFQKKFPEAAARCLALNKEKIERQRTTLQWARDVFQQFENFAHPVQQFFAMRQTIETHSVEVKQLPVSDSPAVHQENEEEDGPPAALMAGDEDGPPAVLMADDEDGPPQVLLAGLNRPTDDPFDFKVMLQDPPPLSAEEIKTTSLEYVDRLIPDAIVKGPKLMLQRLVAAQQRVLANVALYDAGEFKAVVDQAQSVLSAVNCQRIFIESKLTPEEKAKIPPTALREVAAEELKLAQGIAFAKPENVRLRAWQLEQERAFTSYLQQFSNTPAKLFQLWGNTQSVIRKGGQDPNIILFLNRQLARVRGAIESQFTALRVRVAQADAQLRKRVCTNYHETRQAVQQVLTQTQKERAALEALAGSVHFPLKPGLSAEELALRHTMKAVLQKAKRQNETNANNVLPLWQSRDALVERYNGLIDDYFDNRNDEVNLKDSFYRFFDINKGDLFRRRAYVNNELKPALKNFELADGGSLFERYEELLAAVTRGLSAFPPRTTDVHDPNYQKSLHWVLSQLQRDLSQHMNAMVNYREFHRQPQVRR